MVKKEESLHSFLVDNNETLFGVREDTSDRASACVKQAILGQFSTIFAMIDHSFSCSLLLLQGQI